MTVGLLLRSAPYPYWQGHISSLLDGIRGEHAEKYSQSVADCPGLSGRPFFRRCHSNLNFFLGYTLDSLREARNGFTAQLNLAGPPCNAFGKDILNLTIQVRYETASRYVL